jgi:hypothetical protein
MTRPDARLRPSIRWGLIVVLLLLPIVLPALGQSGEGETLYNGIHLPSPWPPPLAEIPTEPVSSQSGTIRAIAGSKREAF